MRWTPYLLAIAAGTPWVVLALAGAAVSAPLTAVLTGCAILGAAFLLSWVCEVAEMDIPQALAVSVLALVAVLPEYAVDATFAWKAAKDPAFAGYAIANMTGGNRLLLGLGWPAVVFIAWARRQGRSVSLPKDMGVELAVLLAATLYAAVPVIRGSLTLWDTAVYVLMYLLYLIASARAESHESEPVGPAAALGALPNTPRRLIALALFLGSAFAIYLSAEPFAEALVHTGKELGIDEFLLVQWVAPLASEAPEGVVAVLLTWRGAASIGLRTLVSSKVNQWTLLVGTLAVVFSVASGGPAALPLDERQRTEIMLTAAQSLFGLAVLANLRLSLWQATALAGLFLVQFVFPSAHLLEGIAYMVLFTAILLFDRSSRVGLWYNMGTFFRLLRGAPRA